MQVLKIPSKIVNNEIAMIKKRIDNEHLKKLEKSTKNINIVSEGGKEDTKQKQKYLTPPIKPSEATYYYDKSLKLAVSCEILSEDMILNNINIKTVEEDNLDELTSADYFQDITESIQESQIEISYMCHDYHLYDAGCCKINLFPEQNQFRLTQMPQESLQIMKIEDKKIDPDNAVYIVEQDTKSGDKSYYKILGERYPDNFTHYEGVELGLVWWEGRDSFYNFFSKPSWLQCIESLNSQIAIQSLDTEKINNGFNVNGVLFFNKAPSYFSQANPLTKQDNKSNDPADQNKTHNPLDKSLSYFTQLTQNKAINEQALRIQNELKDSGFGLAVLYEETTDPMTMEHVSLSDQNWEYLVNKEKNADQQIISAFRIPRERYMLNDVKESMNSQKTAAFWEIYVKSLKKRQNLYEKGLRAVINHVYDNITPIKVDIETPIFSELVNEKINTFSNLFSRGVLTLGQLLKLLSKYITDLNLEDVDWSDPVYDQRFLRGQAITDLEGVNLGGHDDVIREAIE